MSPHATSLPPFFFFPPPPPMTAECLRFLRDLSEREPCPQDLPPPPWSFFLFPLPFRHRCGCNGGTKEVNINATPQSTFFFLVPFPHRSKQGDERDKLTFYCFRVSQRRRICMIILFSSSSGVFFAPPSPFFPA